MRRSRVFLLLCITLGLAVIWAGTRPVRGAGSLPQRLWAVSQEGMPDIFASALGAGKFIAGGKHGALYSYPDGKVYADPDGRDIQGIVFSGTQFVAVGVVGISPKPVILTSPDGITWTQQLTPSTQSLFAVTYGGLYAAVGNGGDIITSPDGVTWTARTSGTSEQLRGVAKSLFGAFVAVGRNRTVLTSLDGVTWTPQTAPAGMGSDLNAVVHNGAQFIAVSSGQAIMTSPDGVTWTQQSVPDTTPGQNFEAVAAGIFGPTVVVGDNRIYSSVDGVTWELRSGGPPVPSNGEGRFHQTITYTPLGFVTLGLGGSISFSSDGSSWSSLTLPASREWNDVAYDPAGFCAVGWNGAIASSPDGVVFTNRSGPSDFNLLAYAIAWGDGPGRFVAVSGPSARIHASSDCVTFETVSHGDGFTPAEGITGSLFDVVYGAEDDLFVAVGREETGVGTGLFVPLVATSSDGLTWTQQDTGAAMDGIRLFDTVAYGAGRFVARGLNSNDGAPLLYTSEDGIAWTSQPAPFDAFEFFDDLAYANGVFVAVGGRIWTSPDGINWTLRLDYDSAFRVFSGVAFGDGRFVALNEFGRIFVSPDGESWEEHPAGTSFAQHGIAFSEDLNRFVVVGESIILRTDDPVLNFTPASYEVTEGTLTKILTVTRMGSLGPAVSVDYATSDGTAVAGQDYTAKTASLTIAAGSPTATISIPILNDAFDEAPEETFTVSLSNPSAGVFLGPVDVADVIIEDNDHGGTLELGLESLKVTEGKGAVKVKVPVTRSGPTPLAGGVGVTFTTFAGTAFPGEDYTEVTQTLTFPAGVATVNAEVTILPDAIDENDETFGIRILAPSEGADLGDQTTALVTVADDDSGGSFQFFAPTHSGTEGVGSGQILVKVKRLGGLAAASVDLSIDSGTATPGDDFTVATGQINFASGQTLATVPVTVLNDLLGEGPETVTLKLENPAGGASIGARFTTLVTINDNEPAVQFALAAQRVAESAGSVKVTVSRTAGPGPVSVDYGVTGGTADEPGDFGPVSGNIAFGATELTRILTIPVVNDGDGEGPEMFVLTLSNPVGAYIGARGSDTVTITDNEPAVQFALAAQSVSESAGSVKVTVSRTAGPGPVSVDYGVTGGNADEPGDFGPVSGNIAFGANELTRILTIPVVNDGDGEGPETFVLTLSNPVGAYIGARGSNTVTITDNEPSVKLSLASYKAVSEAVATHVAAFQVMRVGNPAAPFTVGYTTADGTATAGQDYTPTSATLTFAAGQMSQIVNLPLIDDDVAEGGETIRVILENPVGASLGSVPEAVLNVTSNDDPGTIALAPLSSSVLEPDDSSSILVPLTVKRTGKVPLAAISVNVLLTPFASTATDGADFVFTPGTLNFAAGETEKSFNVEILGDGTSCEGLETVALSIQGLGALPPGVSAGQAVVGIVDRTVSFLGPIAAAGMLSKTGPTGTCTWHDTWTGTVLLDFSCPGPAGNVATVRATRILDQGVASSPGLACPTASEPLFFSVPLDDDGTNFFGALGGNSSVAIEGSRSGSSASGTVTFSFIGPRTGDSAGTFTAQKQ